MATHQQSHQKYIPAKAVQSAGGIDVDNLSWNDLRKLVKQHGLSVPGKKLDLQERLK
jgi:hypothetical protein